MKLSETYTEIVGYRNDHGFDEWKDVLPEVAQLEAELEQRRTQIAHLQPVYLEVCEENEALKRELLDERKTALEAMSAADWITDDQYIEATMALDALRDEPPCP